MILHQGRCTFVVSIKVTTNFREVYITANFNKINVADGARTELHDILNLTGAEISINNLPAGAGVPFVHSHKGNEEIYAVLSGRGKAVIDGEHRRLASHLPCLQKTVFRCGGLGYKLCMYSGQGKLP